MSVRELAPRHLVEKFGATEAWWLRHRPTLVSAGLLTKRGRKFFGEPEAIAMWLAGTLAVAA